ncbi:MAG: IS5 family transposase [Nitrospira sp.]|nr:IS5 family transposase [Nitrospira sp.]
MNKANTPSRWWQLPDAVWERIEPLLPKRPTRDPSIGGRPPVPDRQAMNGIVFVLRTGCQWNALNATGICSSSTAHLRFQQWRKAGVFEQLWANGLNEYDEVKGIDWAWQSMDGAMTKAPLGGEKKTGPNPTDRAKDGVKRSLLCEGAGVPIGLAIEGANRHDMRLVEPTLQSIPVARPRPTRKTPQGLCLDKGYDYEEVRNLVRQFGYTAHIRARGEEAQAITRQAGFKARRWVVERTHSWMNRFRRILIRWEKLPENYLAMLHVVCAVITLRCAGVLG